MGGNGADRRQRVLDAVVKLFQNQLLQPVGSLARLGVDARLLEQRLGTELGLGQQQPETDVLGGQLLLGEARPRDQIKAFPVVIAFEHGQA